MDKIRGSTESQYAQLWDYVDALTESNLISTMKMKVNGDQNSILRGFMCALRLVRKGGEKDADHL